MHSGIAAKIKRQNHLISELNSVYHNAALKLGLSDSSMQVIYTICDFGDSCLLSDICYLTRLSKQTINSALRRLERDGWIRLEPETSKSKRVFLTESGKSLADKTALRMMDAENAVFASWTSEDVNRYFELTQRFIRLIKEKIKDF